MSPRAWLMLLYRFHVFKLQATNNQWVIKPTGLQAELKRKELEDTTLEVLLHLVRINIPVTFSIYFYVLA